jgi:hypothetical protein
VREECKLRVITNNVLRGIFRPKRDEVTEEWRRLHNKELYAVYSSPNIIHSREQIKKTDMGGARSTYREEDR